MDARLWINTQESNIIIWWCLRCEAKREELGDASIDRIETLLRKFSLNSI